MRVKFFPLLRYTFLKHTLLPLCAALLLCLILPLVFSLKNLDAVGSAIPLELLFSLSGILLLTPIFLPEQENAVCDVVRMRATPLFLLYLLRAVLSLCLLALLTAALVGVLALTGCTVSPLLWLGTVSSGVLLGGLGALAYALTGGISTACMVPVLFYLFNYFLGAKLSVFYLFSISANVWDGKPVQLFTGLLLLGGSILLCSQRRSLWK